ncbi:MAG: histidine kinase [Frankiales bacterium]|nr:histidine kinase [Frankiales bacterium]
MISEDGLRALTALSGVVLAQEDISSTHDEICRIALRVLPQADGSSLTSFTDEGPKAAAASDDWARELDELQFVEHEGPCLDCVRTGNVFRVRDLGADGRWPNWSPRAQERGARSIISLPLAAEGRRVGALNLYSRRPDAFDAEAASLAEIVAAHAGLATQVAASFFSHRELGEQLRQAMESREVIEQAKGIIMGARRVDADEAFTVLVELSQRSNRKLRDVAQALVDEAPGARTG